MFSLGLPHLGLGLVLLYPHGTALRILKPLPGVQRSDFCPLPLLLIYLYTTPIAAYCVQALLNTLRIQPSSYCYYSGYKDEVTL